MISLYINEHAPLHVLKAGFLQKHILYCAFTSCVQGVLLLDLEASDLPAIVNAVVDKLVTHDLLAEEDRGKLMRTLLLKHK